MGNSDGVKQHLVRVALLMLLVWLLVIALGLAAKKPEKSAHRWYSEIQGEMQSQPAWFMGANFTCPQYTLTGETENDKKEKVPVTTTMPARTYGYVKLDLCVMHGELRVLEAQLPPEGFHCPRGN